MTRPVTAVGLGHVGAVAAACLANRGHSVIAVDRDPARVDALEAARPPVDEPGLAAALAAARLSGRLVTSASLPEAVTRSRASLLCVGTPMAPDGNADLRDLDAAIAALADFDNPEGVVIGESDRRDGDVVIALLARRHGPTITRCDTATAELLKYVHNAWNAARVSFANELGALATGMGLDAASVLGAFAGNATGAVSARYLAPGAPWGGACLRKDLEALCTLAAGAGTAAPLLAAVVASNAAHLDRCVARIVAHRGLRIGIVGLAFKPGIGDVRDSPYVTLAERVLADGVDVRLFAARVEDADLAPALQARRCPTLEDLAARCDLLVLCHGDAATRSALARAAPRLATIDMSMSTLRPPPDDHCDAAAA